MTRLHLRLLGPPQIELDGQPVHLKRRKATALLAYLAQSRQTHGRDSLAALFWPEYDQRSARASLRRTLSSLKKSLDDRWLLVEGDYVSLQLGSNLWVDVEEFRGLLPAGETHDHPPEDVCPACLPLLSEAVNLYRNDFMAGFSLRDSPTFDDWQLFQTEELRRELVNVLEKLVQGYINLGEFHLAIPYARRLQNLDPLHEPAIRQLMRLYAWSGQQAAAVRLYQESVQILVRELTLPPADETQELFQTISANQLLPPSAKHQTSAPTAPKPSPDNLPTRHSPFVGRQEELSEIVRLLTQETACRLVTLVGLGGVGKTSLALEVAGQLIEVFPDGVYLVSLASVSDLSFIVPAIAQALNVRLQGAKEPKKQLLEHLRTRQTLLIMDNFEHLLAGSDLLVDILAAAPGVVFLVTSRELLNLREEWVFEIRGLSYPAEPGLQKVAEVANLEEYTAVRLFMQYARRAHAGFAASRDDLPYIVQLCQLVDGLPLALELASPWVRSMTCREIAGEVAQNLDFLSSSMRNIPERHRSLRVIFQETWQQLSGQEQSVMSKLSVFRGGFRREAAEQVAAASLPTLAALVEKALLRRSNDGRYDMHELILQFAAEQLALDPGAYAAVQAGHGAYYATFLYQYRHEIMSQNMLNFLETIRQEIGNVFAAWDWAVQQKDVPFFELTIDSLTLFWMYSSREREGINAINQAITALVGSTELAENGQIPQPPQHLRGIVGFLIAVLGALNNRAGLLQKGQILLEQGVELVSISPANSKGREAQSRHWLSTCYHWQGRFAAAVSQLQIALAQFSQIQDPFGIAWCLTRLGSARHQQGRLEEAKQYLSKSEVLVEEYGFSMTGNVNRLILAIIAIDQGEYNLAEELLAESIATGRSIGNYLDLAGTIQERGRLHLMTGRYDQAQRDLSESIDLFRKQGTEWFYKTSFGNLAALYRLQKKYGEAQQLYRRSLQAAQEVNNQRLAARFLSGLGMVAYDQGDYGLAEKYQRQALGMQKELGNEPELAMTLRCQGHVASRLGHDDYRQIYAASLRLAKTHRLAPVALDIFVGLALGNAQSGNVQEAVKFLTLVGGHPSSTYETRIKARDSLAAITANIEDEELAIAQENGRALNLWNVVETVLSRA